MIKEIFSDGIFSLFNKICYFGFKTLAIILITRSLGEDVGGEFIFLVGFLEVLRVVTDFGVDLFVIKKYNDSTDKIKLLNVTFAQKILSGVIVLLLFCLYSFVQGYQYNVYIPIVLALPVALFFNFSNSYFQSLNSNKSLTFPIAIASIATCTIFAIQYFLNVKFNAWDYLCVELLFVSLVTLKLFVSVKFRFIRTSAFDVLMSILSLYKYTLSIGLTAVVVIIYSRIDNFYLKTFAPGDLAAYGQIFRMVDPLVMVSSVFSTVAYARFCRINLQEKNAFTKVFQFLLCIVAYGVLSSLVYFFIIKYLGHFVLISNVNNDFLIMMFLIVACVKCINGGTTAIIQSQGFYKVGLYVSYVCILTSIPTMYFLIMKYGVKGAAMTILLVECISFILLLCSFFMIKKMRPKKNIRNVINESSLNRISLFYL